MRVEQERELQGEPLEPVSVTIAAMRLGVSRSTIWKMIADGELDADSVTRSGRTYTRVYLPQPHPETGVPKSRISGLQEQVDRLTEAVDRLSGLLKEKEREVHQLESNLQRRTNRSNHGRMQLPPQEDTPQLPRRSPMRRLPAAHIPASAVEVSQPLAAIPEEELEAVAEQATFTSLAAIPMGITSRPNPMTYPSGSYFAEVELSRDVALAPVRDLFKSRRRGLKDLLNR